MKFDDSYTYKFRRMYSNLPDKTRKIKKFYALFIIIGLAIYILLSVFSKIDWKEIVFYSLKVIFVTVETYFIIKAIIINETIIKYNDN